jgi:hypothetical protein
MLFYYGVRKIKTDRDTLWEARIGRGAISRCLGFRQTAEEAARLYNKHAAPLRLDLNTDIDPAFRRIRTADGELRVLCICGQCGQSLQMPQIDPVTCCGRTYHKPDNVETLPIEQSQNHTKAVRKARRQLDHIMREEMQDKMGRKTLFADVPKATAPPDLRRR